MARQPQFRPRKGQIKSCGAVFYPDLEFAQAAVATRRSARAAAKGRREKIDPFRERRNGQNQTA
jgi:hypothetical protein